MPKIAALYQSHDSFVRLAATMVLRRLGAPAAATLQIALIDDNKDVAQIAGRALRDLGPASVDALPMLIKMLDGPRESKDVALTVIQGIGPGAAAAAPKMLETWPDYFLHGYSPYISAFAAIGRPAAEPAVPLIEKMLRKEVDPGSGVYIVHDVFAVGHHALFVLTGEREHLQALLQLLPDRVNGHTAASRLRDLGAAAAEIVPETRQLLGKDGLPPDRWTAPRNRPIGSNPSGWYNHFSWTPVVASLY